MIASYSGNTHGGVGGINELQNQPQNLHAKIKFTMEHILKESPFLDILTKT